MVSLDLKSKIRKKRFPACTSSPIPPSVSTCFGAGSGVRSLDPPAITPSSPPFPPFPEEQEVPTNSVATKVTSSSIFAIPCSRLNLSARVPPIAGSPTRPPPQWAYRLTSTNRVCPHAPTLSPSIFRQHSSALSRFAPRRIVPSPRTVAPGRSLVLPQLGKLSAYNDSQWYRTSANRPFGFR